ncbi:MAG: NAD(P)-dependent oxidoreductase [Lentisphaerae bacterium]|nr:MAG: NAD(P)-dependent oxidoreductase [Lentisphaerota bacterium]
MTLAKSRVGVIGLGQMGGGVAKNLLKAGWQVYGFDLKEEALERLKNFGGEPMPDISTLLEHSDIVLTSLEGKVCRKVMTGEILPRCRRGQRFIDLSTIPCPLARQFAAQFAEKGCDFMDAPVSGGKWKAEDGTLRVFVGGERTSFERHLELFLAFGDPEKIVYCGEAGQGQAAKVVQQLTHRLPDMARMEVMAFGLRTGLTLDVVMRALDVDPQSDDPYARLYRALQDGNMDDISTVFAEWEYYLEEVRERGFRMPMLEALYAFCREAEKVTKDNVGRPMPSLWRELMTRSNHSSKDD